MTGTPPPSPKKKGEKKPANGASVSDTKEGTAVIQWLVREVGVRSSYPALTKTNYSNWAQLMKVKLKARGLWRAIDGGNVDDQEHMMALDVICTAVPTDLARVIADKETAKEAC
ncbi:unnamed protein product [Urochloa humidicola]